MQSPTTSRAPRSTPRRAGAGQSGRRVGWERRCAGVNMAASPCADHATPTLTSSIIDPPPASNRRGCRCWPATAAAATAPRPCSTMHTRCMATPWPPPPTAPHATSWASAPSCSAGARRCRVAGRGSWLLGGWARACLCTRHAAHVLGSRPAPSCSPAWACLGCPSPFWLAGPPTRAPAPMPPPGPPTTTPAGRTCSGASLRSWGPAWLACLWVSDCPPAACCPGGCWLGGGIWER